MGELTGLSDLARLGGPPGTNGANGAASGNGAAGVNSSGGVPGRRRGTFTLPGDQLAPLPVPPAAERVVVPAARERDPGSDTPWGALAESMTSAMVADLREDAATRLQGVSDGLPLADQREQARPVVAELVSVQARQAVHLTGQHWTQRQTAALVQVVLDEMFGLGRLQPLVDDERVNNISIHGCDDVVVELADGQRVRVGPVADSDEDLIRFIKFLAERDPTNPRDFSKASPRLRMNIDNRLRLAAIAWRVPRPSVVIRRHRLVRITLEDLAGMGTMSPLLASFLTAAVRDGRSIVVSGLQNAGKTTCARALCAAIPFHETVVTVESERELFLHEMPEQHLRVFSIEAHQGSSEVLPDGSRPSQFTLQDGLIASKALSADRQIVGEVLGAEVLDMLEAMRSSRGSISTVHAESARATVGRLASLAMRAGPQVTAEYAIREIVSGIDLVVHVSAHTEIDAHGQPRTRRWVSQVLAVAPGEDAHGAETTVVFDDAGTGGDARPRDWPDGQGYERLSRHGFDRVAFDVARTS